MMKAKAKEQSEDSRCRDVQGDNPNLDNRYGRIGISAVAAAVRYQGEHRGPRLRVAPYVPYDRD
jgi:hypothetical protein